VNYLELFNGLGTRVKPVTYRPADALSQRLQEHGLDSLDVVLLCVYACEVFGIPEETGKSLNPATFDDIRAFVEKHRTRTPASVAAALALVDG
jgi:hypothetical protein